MVKINKLLAGVALGSALNIGNVWATDVDAKVARMQAMDKITGRVSVIEVPINSEVKFGSFSIVVRSCKTRPPEETPENKAFVDVVDSYNSENPVNIFKGWMFSSSPSVNAVEHPIYDVWLLKCHNENIKATKLTDDELADRDEIEQVRPEIENIDKEVAVKEKKVEEEPIKIDEVIKREELLETPKTIENNNMDNQAVENIEGGPKALINITPPKTVENIQINEEKIDETVEENVAEIEEVIKIEAPLIITETAEVETTASQEEQLIDLSEEIEEDEYDINADALVQ